MKTHLEIPAALQAMMPPDPRVLPQRQAPAPEVPFKQVLSKTINDTPSATPSTYTVRKGDTLSHIALRLLKEKGQRGTGTAIQNTVRELAQENNLQDPDKIRPGQVLKLGLFSAAPEAPVEQVAQAQPEKAAPVETPPPSRQEEELNAAAIAKQLADLALAQPAPPIVPHVPAEGGPALPKPNPVNSFVGKVAQEAAEKTVDLTQLIQKILHPGAQTDFLPKRESPWTRTLGAPARLTSEFGKRKDPFTGDAAFHGGIDLATKAGTSIYPFKDGVVTFSGWKAGYGNVVFVKHEDGLESVYGHNRKNLVKPGDTVTAQTVLAEVGSSGRSTGPHLHFEVRKRGKSVDPVPYLQK